MTQGDGAPASERRAERSAAFEGLRGLACLLVVLLHVWTIVPVEELRRLGPFYGLFTSGNLGVTLFFVLGSFLVTRSLLAELDGSGAIDAGRFWMRRGVRLGSQLSLFVAVLYVVSLVDRWDSWTPEQTQRSLMTASSFTFNWSLVADPSANRDDLGHLWYLSVEQQFYVVWVLALTFLARLRRSLIVATAAGAVAVMLYRWHVLESGNVWAAELRTFTRADGLLLGALAALALPYVRRYRSIAPAVATISLAAATALVYLSPHLDAYAFLQTQGIAFAVVATALVLAIAIGGGDRGLADRSLSSPPLRLLGAVSYPLYLWHFPVFWASSRWARGMTWRPRAIASVLALTIIVAITYRWVEVPARRWLERRRRPHASASRATEEQPLAMLPSGNM